MSDRQASPRPGASRARLALLIALRTALHVGPASAFADACIEPVLVGRGRATVCNAETISDLYFEVGVGGKLLTPADDKLAGEVRMGSFEGKAVLV